MGSGGRKGGQEGLQEVPGKDTEKRKREKTAMGQNRVARRNSK